MSIREIARRYDEWSKDQSKPYPGDQDNDMYMLSDAYVAENSIEPILETQTIALRNEDFITLYLEIVVQKERAEVYLRSERDSILIKDTIITKGELFALRRILG